MSYKKQFNTLSVNKFSSFSIKFGLMSEGTVGFIVATVVRLVVETVSFEEDVVADKHAGKKPKPQ
jgi:O-acetyl-ADP-ribose deacetylase (regulator of RNase III)